MKKVQLTAVQMSSRPKPEDNLDIVKKLLNNLPSSNQPHLVVLPEAFVCFGAGVATFPGHLRVVHIHGLIALYQL